MSAASRVANHLYLAAALPSAARFARALRDPRAAQLSILRRLVRDNVETAFGRDHGFARILSLADFRARVPVRDYDGFARWVRRVGYGERGVLTAEEVRFVEPTGGSSGAHKEVPYTQSLLREFSAATMPWVYDLLRSRPALRGGRAYWAVSPPARHAEKTPGGVPIGMEHDSDYFPRPIRALLDAALGLPRAVSRAPDIATCRYLTLRSLLAMPDLAMVSVWSPSFLTLLADALRDWYPRLLRDLETGELSVDLDPALAAELRRALPARPALATGLRNRFGERAPEDLGLLWSRLSLISCWTDGHARRALDGVRRHFPRVEIQGKGLMATEGVVSFPLFRAEHPVAAVASHFLEFMPEGDPSTFLLADELEIGATYEVLLTTGGGFYRYRLKDLVRVEGRLERTPMLRFVGRADRASDLAGEKLTPELAERVLREASASVGVRPAFAMLAPEWGTPPRYRLYVDLPWPQAERLSAEVERRLLEAHHYRLCRDLGQLGPVDAVAVIEPERVYERVCQERGQRAGAIKPAALDPGLEWARAFAWCEVPVA